MSSSLLALVLLGLGTELGQPQGSRLEGIAVNATQNGKPIADAEVVLRAGEEGSLQIIAQTKTDRDGHFQFDRLPNSPGLVFLAGVNHHGVHYPGPKVQLPSGGSLLAVQLTAFDAVASPSPLVADRHEIDVEIQKGALQVTEMLWVNNPSLTTYVGQDVIGALPTTLSLLIPDGFERVTFHSEFNGRHFKLRDNQLYTDIPWTPGKREVKFTYLLPIEDGKRLLEWSVNVPCSHYRLRIRGENADRFECNLPRAAGPDQGTSVFESTEPIAAEHIVKLELGRLPTSWVVYLRWSALAILAGLIVITASYRIMRRAPADSSTALPRKAKAA
jgi:hypothetical protein